MARKWSRRAEKLKRRRGRIVQHGTQQRGSVERGKEIAAVHSEKYGKLLVSKGYCCKPRWSIGYKPFAQPPENLEFDVWVGPALDDSCWTVPKPLGPSEQDSREDTR